MAGHFLKSICAGAFLSFTIVALGGCDHPQSTPERVSATPEPASAASNEVSQALIGKTITIHGRFSLDGVSGPYILLNNQQEVYLTNTVGDSFTWGPPYSEMHRKLVEATGVLRFNHMPDDAPRTDKQGRLVARSPDFFYFERETTRLRLIDQ